MSLAMTHASSPDHWLGWLAASIGGYLNDQETIDDLDQDYRDFLRSPVATDELRRILPPPRKRRKVRAPAKTVGH